MRELKVGDKVKVRSDLVVGAFYDNMYFTEGMLKCCGEEATVSEVSKSAFKLLEDKTASNWTSVMFESEPSSTDAINSPSHYLHGGIETIEVIRMMLTPEEFKGYCKGNIIKYRERAPYKGKEEEDYAKALKYKEFLEETNKE